jgi:hypothetical protein
MDYRACLELPDLGPIMKTLDLDETMTMSLYFANQRKIGVKSIYYQSLKTATYPDTPLDWTDEEIEAIQDKVTIDRIRS